MKSFATLLFILILIPCFNLFAFAEDIYENAAEKFGVDRLDDILTEDEKSISGDFDFNGKYDVSGSLARLWEKFIGAVLQEIKANYKFAFTLIFIALLCALSTALCRKKEISEFIEISACGAAALLLLGGIDSMVRETLDAMYRLSDYSKAALPVVFTAAAAGGALSSSASKFAAVTFALDVLMSLSQRIIIPAINAFLSLSIAQAMFPNAVLALVQKLCKWTCGTLMSAMTIAFTAYINMIGAIGSAVDASAVKTARSFISGALPVVGGMISDASAMILSAAGVIKNCAGVYGLIAVAVMCAGPFAILSTKMLIFKAVSAAAESMQSARLTSLYSGMSNAMGLLLGLLGSCGIMLFISLTAAMKAVTF